MNGYLKDFCSSTQVAMGDYIPESLFYLLGMKANNKKAQKFQTWLATDVIPNIRKGNYVILTEKDKANLSLKEEYKERIDYLPYGTRKKLFRWHGRSI